MKNFYILLLLVSIVSNAQCIEDSYLSLINGKGNEGVWDIASDNQENTYTIGTFDGVVEFGGELHTNPFIGIYVVKHDCDGQLQWSLVPKFQSSIGEVRPTVSVSDDHVYISFTYYGKMTLNNAEFIANNVNMFFAKMDLDGNLIWTKSIESPNFSIPYSSGIVADNQDNLYFTGRFNSDIYLNGQQLASTNRTVCYVGKFDSEGNLDWFLDEKISGFSRGWSMALDQQQNLLLGGYFGGNFQLGDFTVTNPNPDDTESNSYIAKINPEGIVQWVSVGYCPLFSHPYGISVDSDNNILAVGGFDSTIQFEDTVFESKGRSDAYVVKYDSNGNLIWANAFGGEQELGGEWATSIHQKTNGDYITIAQLLNQPILNGRTYNTGSNQDLYVVELSNSGEIRNAFKTGGPASVDVSYDSDLVGDKLIVAAWHNQEETKIGCNLIPNSDAQVATSDVFLWKSNINDLFQPVDSNIGFAFEVLNNSQINLTSTNAAAADSIVWHLDGIQTISGANASFETTIGTHEVCMNYYACPYADQFCQTIVLEESALPISNFVFDVNDFKVDFTDLSSNSPISWEWIFGDEGNSSEQNPSFTFSQEGNFEVCLTASNSVGAGNIYCKTITINSAALAPVSNFDFTVNGQIVNFTDLSENDPKTWEWKLEDLVFSTGQNPIFTFPSLDIFEVCMTASNQVGPGNQVCKTIDLREGPEPPVSNFSYVISGKTVNFVDLSSNDPNAWSWNFANLGTSDKQSPVFTFPDATVYNICLIASNNQGPGNEVCKTIDLTDTGLNDFHFSNNSVYPVPARNFAIIEVDNPGFKTQLAVYDLTGKQISIDYQISPEGIQLFRGNLASGLYIYKCSDDNKFIQTGNLIFE